MGGPAANFVETATEADLIAAVRDADSTGTPLLVIGGGSNLLVADAGFDGVVVRDGRRELAVQNDGFCGGASVTATAGLPWDVLVERSISDRWVGLEALSGIPGSAGATPVQNVGAYGAEVADTLSTVRVWDRLTSRVRTLVSIELRFSYRDSVLKRSMLADAEGGPWFPTPRYVVLDVTFHMRLGTRSAPIRYRQLADALGVEVGGTASTAAVRDAVLALRGSKGMVLESADHNTWSAGSFFTNPIVSAERSAELPDDAPRYVWTEGRVKTSAAWLIERSGFPKGFALPGSSASLSTVHTLALTNRGGALASDVVALARHIRDGVIRAYGIELVPEPMLVGVAL